MQCGLNRPHYSKEHGLFALEGWLTGKRFSEVSCSLFSFGMNMTDSVVELLCKVLLGFSSHEVLREGKLVFFSVSIFLLFRNYFLRNNRNILIILLFVPQLLNDIFKNSFLRPLFSELLCYLF